MNCRPGDLAVVLPNYLDHPMVGAVVSVVCASSGAITAKDGTVSRVLCAEGRTWLCDGYANFLPCLISDDCLRPITPPASTVTDEEVRELFAPKQTEAA